MANITQELSTIHDDPLGKNVKLAIYSALYKVNEDLEHLEPGNESYPIDHMSVTFFNGYNLPFLLGNMGDNPNPEYVWIKSTDTHIMPVRDGWCVIEERFSSDTESSSYETGTISDSGGHTWTNLANYKLLANSEGTSFVYCHLWITYLNAGESISLSGDREYAYMGFLIQNGEEGSEPWTVESAVLDDVPYVAPRIVSSNYTTVVYFTSDSIGHMGTDMCSIRIKEGTGEATRYPEYGSGGKLFMFVKDSDEEDTVVFEENPGNLIPFFSGGTAITTFAV